MSPVSVREEVVNEVIYLVQGHLEDTSKLSPVAVPRTNQYNPEKGRVCISRHYRGNGSGTKVIEIEKQ